MLPQHKQWRIADVAAPNETEKTIDYTAVTWIWEGQEGILLTIKRVISIRTDDMSSIGMDFIKQTLEVVYLIGDVVWVI